MRSLLSPHGVYSPADVDSVLARVFGAGVRPLHIEEAVFEAMVDGWRAQQTARYLKPKTIQHNERGVRAFVEHIGRFPWEWRASDLDEYFEDLLSRPQRLARSTLRAYQWRLKGFSEYVCDRRYPWTVICEREFGRAPGQLFDERNLVAHLDEFEGDPRRRPLTVDELDAFFAACDERVTRARTSGRKGRCRRGGTRRCSRSRSAGDCAGGSWRRSTSATFGPTRGCPSSAATRRCTCATASRGAAAARNAARC
jgi:hypothetical protein